MRAILQRLRSILLTDRPVNQKLTDLWWELTSALNEEPVMRQPAICCSMCGALTRLGDKCGCGFTNAWCPKCKKVRVNKLCPVCGSETQWGCATLPENANGEDDRSST